MPGSMVIELEDYYSMLNLRYPSHPKEIHAAYKRLAKLYHPDAQPANGHPQDDRFQKINFAYQVLGNNAEKENYDFLYLKYIVREPYLNKEGDCASGSCGCTPPVPDIKHNKNKVLIYGLAILLILAMFLRYVL